MEEGLLGPGLRLLKRERAEEGAALAFDILTDLSSWSTSALLGCVHQQPKSPLRLSLLICKKGTP